MLTQSELKSLLKYDHESGVFTRLTNGGGRKAGDLAGFVSDKGYVIIKIGKKAYKAHRLAWLYMTGSFPSGVIDHVNRDKTDNRFGNLRDVTQRENVANSGLSRKNTSGHKGVSWNKHLGRWMVSAKKDGKQHYIGSSKLLDSAVAMKARWDSADERMPSGAQV